MTTSVAINGFGRVGRAAFRAAYERDLGLEFVGINDLADPHALTNLLNNALQYTQDSGAIRIQIVSSEAATVIRIQDNGFGFTLTEAGRAGTPFTSFRRPGAVTGTGLGLAIATSLARRMGGSLNISGKIGEGAVAELRLRSA